MQQIIILSILICFLITALPTVDAYWLNGIEHKSSERAISVGKEPPTNPEENVADPNAFGKLILEESEFQLYGGTVIAVPIFIEMNDFIHNPTLDIFYDDALIKTIYPRSNGDIFQ